RSGQEGLTRTWRRRIRYLIRYIARHVGFDERGDCLGLRPQRKMPTQVGGRFTFWKEDLHALLSQPVALVWRDRRRGRLDGSVAAARRAGRGRRARRGPHRGGRSARWTAPGRG